MVALSPAPCRGAVQVADRWHLLENASAAFLSAIQKAMPGIRRTLGSTRIDPALLTAAERLQYEGFQRRLLTNKMVRRMAEDGMPINRLKTLKRQMYGRANIDLLKACVVAAA